MQQARIVDAGQPLKVVDLPIPAAPAKGARLRTTYSGICHSDMHVIKDEVQFLFGVVMKHRELYKKFGMLLPPNGLRLKPYKVIAKKFSKKLGFPLKFTPCPIIHSEIRVGILSLLPAGEQLFKMANNMDPYGQNTKYSGKKLFHGIFLLRKA